jgi:hypothetical protein
MSKEKWWEDSPVLEATGKHNIDFEVESTVQDMELSGHEKADVHIARAKMKKEAQVMYKDLLEKLEKKRQAG